MSLPPAPVSTSFPCTCPFDDVRTGVAAQRVGRGAAGEIFHCCERVARSFPGILAWGREVDRHPSGRGGVARRIDTGAAIEDIGTRTSEEDVVATGPAERVIACSARENVGATIAGEPRRCPSSRR